ncbi:MAG: ABC transporter permease [Bacteroidota bacterium]
MLFNYFKIAFRSLLKFKGFTSINLAGLSMGLTAGILIMVYVLDERSFDQFHTHKDRLYRVTTLFQTSESDGGGMNETNGWPIGKILANEFPEVEAMVYARSASFLLVNHEDKRIRENNHFVSGDFFKMFSFPLLSGNPNTALTEPFTVVISEDMARKYFNGTDALNKTLTVADTLSLLVTGVMKNIPSNSHIQADMLVSFATYERLETSFSYEGGWGNINIRNYVMLKPGVDFKSLAAKARNIYMDRVGDQMKGWGVSAYVGFEPMTQIYLHSKSGNGMGPLGSMQRLYLLSGIAAFVILLACINFINLSTARSVYRAREVGLRKVVGSTRIGLIRQFLSESFLVTLLAFFLAIALTGALLPLFNMLIGKNYQLALLATPPVMMGMAALVLFIGLLAGYYPAWVLSGMRPVEVLKGKMQNSSRGIQLRRTLVVVQFVISVGLVIGTLVVLDQLQYMQKQELGFSKDEIFVINASRTQSPNPDAYETFKNELKKFPMVKAVSYANAVPGVYGWPGQVAYAEGKPPEEAVSVEYMAVDADYVKTLGLRVVAGRNLDEQRETDRKDGLLINEAAAAIMGWSNEEAIGKKISSPSGYPAGEVVGVVADYHQMGLQQKIGPIVMDYNPESSYLYAVRYQASETQQLTTLMADLWKQNFPGYDFNYFFLDQNFEKQYQAEQRLANVFGLFALVTILIASIGLLGLVSFMVVARTKEIGVRKVLGANVFQVVRLLSKEFVALVLVANAIAFPLAWYFAADWLDGFAYRTTISPLLFVWTLLIALGVTLLTVSYQTLRAAMADPVQSLRYE